MNFVNLDNLGVALFTYNTNVDPGTSGASGAQYAQSSFGRTYDLAPFYSGGGKVVMNQTLSVKRILGMPVLQADSFRSLTTSTPSDLVYFGFTILSSSGVNFTNGIQYSGYIEMDTIFFARKELLTSFFVSREDQEAMRIVFKKKQQARHQKADEDEKKRSQELVAHKKAIEMKVALLEAQETWQE